jgi:hypothetical protein
MGDRFSHSNKGVYVCCDSLHVFNLPPDIKADNNFVRLFTNMSKFADIFHFHGNEKYSIG